MAIPGEELPEGWYRELSIEFSDGSKEILHIQRKPTGTHIPLLRERPEPWTDLAFHKCPGCPLPSMILSCPAAVSLQTTMSKLRNRHSIERVKATAIDERGRAQTVEWALQDVGGTLVQLAVFASSCPIGRKVKPYLAGLPPFVSTLELSRRIGAQILKKYGGSMEASQKELVETMDPLHEVFVHLAERLRADDATHEYRPAADAVPNSISSMDAFSQRLALRADRLFQEVSKDMWGGAPPPKAASGAAPEKAGGWLQRLLAFFR